MLSHIEEINLPLLKEKQIQLFVKRDDLIHPYISGNKYRKLIYGLKDFNKRNVKTLVTFGGAYSNHIHAFAYACKENNIKSIGIIRGEELKDKPLNDTLQFAKTCGMELIFVSRKEYKERNNEDYLNKLKEKYQADIVPEGGSMDSATLGLVDMVKEINQVEDFDYICTPCGTGGTISGIIEGSNKKQQVLGFLALKGIKSDIISKIESQTKNVNYELISDYHFGGYAKYNEKLIDFIKEIKLQTNIQFEQIYNGKMLFGILDMIKQGKFKSGDKICVVHTGGIQGLLKDLKD